MSDEDLDPVDVGNDDESEVSDGVAVMRTRLGRGVLLPRSLQGLSGDAAEAVADLQSCALEIHEKQRALEVFVHEARGYGVSWAGIGWSVGTSAEAARQRWGSGSGQ
jgi:hypothetical protein